jgi:hypothetical protein
MINKLAYSVYVVPVKDPRICYTLAEFTNGARGNENSYNEITGSMECGENSRRVRWSRASPPREKFMIDLAKGNFIFLPARPHEG